MDLSRALDTLPHDLTVSKLRQYGADERTPSLIKDYLSNRLQRVELADRNSTWQEVDAGVTNDHQCDKKGIPAACCTETFEKHSTS